MDGTKTGGFLEELRTPYKEGQGVATRRLAIWLSVFFIAWGCQDLWIWLQGFDVMQRSLHESLPRLPMGLKISASLFSVLVLFGGAVAWASWYLKRPWLADLLIETEAEVKKVSWPASDEAWSATKVVTWTVIIFTSFLMLFDLVIQKFMLLIFGVEI